MSVSRDLRELPLFSDFSEAEAKIFAELMEEEEYKEGDVIFDEKTPSCALFFIFSGRVGTFKSGPGAGNYLTILEKKDMFGEVSFIDQKAPPASAKALANTYLGKFTTQQFAKIQWENPPLGFEFLLRLVQEISRRVRAFSEGADLKSSDVTISEVISSGSQIKISTMTVDYICKIIHFDKNSPNPLLKIDIKGYTLLVPLSQIKSIALPNREGKFL